MTRKGSVHIEKVGHRRWVFRVEGDPTDPKRQIDGSIEEIGYQTFDVTVRRNYPTAIDESGTQSEPHPVEEILFGISEAELQELLQEPGPFDTSEVTTTSTGELPGATAGEARALTTQGDPPPSGPSETDRAKAPAPSAPQPPPAADQGMRGKATRDEGRTYDPVMERRAKAEEARKNLWSSSKTVDVYRALTANGVPMARQDPRIQDYWRRFIDPTRKTDRLKAMSGVSALAGTAVGLGAIAAPSLASGAASVAGNLRMAAGMGSPGAAAFSLLASYPRLSMLAMDIMAGLAEVPSVSGAVAKGGRRLAPEAVRMFRSKFGTSRGRALLNTAAEIGADVNLAAGPGECFPEDTPIYTTRGETPIQDIRVGDRVWSYDERRQRRELNRVTRAHRSHSEELVTIALENDEIRATPGHPFWSDRRGWIRAESLQAGDTLRAIDGRPLKVEQATVERKPGEVYNFEVRGAHTYYASTSAVLVHNTNCASRAAIIVRKIVGKPATQMEYGGEAEGLVVSYSLYKKIRRVIGSAWDDFQGHHLVEDHLFKGAKDPLMRPLGNYVPTLPATVNEHLSTIHTGLNASLEAAGLYQRPLSNKEILQALAVSYDFYAKNGLGHIASSILQFTEEVFWPIFLKNPNK